MLSPLTLPLPERELPRPSAVAELLASEIPSLYAKNVFSPSTYDAPRCLSRSSRYTPCAPALRQYIDWPSPLSACSHAAVPAATTAKYLNTELLAAGNTSEAHLWCPLWGDRDAAGAQSRRPHWACWRHSLTQLVPGGAAPTVPPADGAL
jgi:hypothetical protein